LQGFPGQSLGIAQRPVARETPYIPIKAAELLLDFQKTSGIGDGSFDFQTIADDAGVVHQTFHIRLFEFCDLARIEILKRLSEIVALSQDSNPAQPGLEAFKNQHLEYLPIIVNSDPPLLIVILTIQRILRAPPAPRLTLHLSSRLRPALPIISPLWR